MTWLFGQTPCPQVHVSNALPSNSDVLTAGGADPPRVVELSLGGNGIRQAVGANDREALWMPHSRDATHTRRI
ncbi:unnamed protein product [Ectocarpus sp. CCAP 1310/34]|nr:unnamed protein product [Ectocarpus sp. CCAP 1310/34]